MLIKADQSCLMVIDVQERLVPAMQGPGAGDSQHPELDDGGVQARHPYALD